MDKRAQVRLASASSSASSNPPSNLRHHGRPRERERAGHRRLCKKTGELYARAAEADPPSAYSNHWSLKGLTRQPPNAARQCQPDSVHLAPPPRPAREGVGASNHHAKGTPRAALFDEEIVAAASRPPRTRSTPTSNHTHRIWLLRSSSSLLPTGRKPNSGKQPQQLPNLTTPEPPLRHLRSATPTEGARGQPRFGCFFAQERGGRRQRGRGGAVRWFH